MITELDKANPLVMKQLLSVQIKSYTVEATLLNYHDLPPLKDTIKTLQECEEFIFGYFIEKTLCGAISYKINDNELDIHRLIVHPDYFRKGIAQSLLNITLNIVGISRIVVSTGAGNYPAIRLYQKNGFQEKENVILNDGLVITSLEKIIN